MGSFRCCHLLLVVACCSLLEKSSAFSNGQHGQRMTGFWRKSVSIRQMANTEPSSSGQPFNISTAGPGIADDDFIMSNFESSAVATEAQKSANGAIVEVVDEEDEKIDMWSARLLLLAIAIIWGTNFASVKYLETLCFNPPCVHPPSEAALARFGVATVVSLPLLLGQRKDIILAGLECGAWISLGYITQAVALATIPSGKCAFICSLTVVVVPLISAIFFGKTIKPLNIVAAAIALSGVAILEGLVDTSAVTHLLDGGVAETATKAITTTTATSSSSNFLEQIANGHFAIGKGDAVALGQPFGFGMAFLRIEHYVEKFKEEKNQILTLSAAQCLAVGSISLLWVLYDFHGTIPDMHYMLDPHRVAAIAWTGIVTTVLAIYFEGVALQTASASDAALTFASEPVWASLFGVWLLHEHLTMNAYIGGSIILLACLVGVASDLPGPGEAKPSEETSTTSG